MIRPTAPAMWNSSKVDLPDRENLSQLSDNCAAQTQLQYCRPRTRVCLPGAAIELAVKIG